ncbi:helix-turn-helix domain-containing protein [Candidatus Poriferisodalis sp.]|uniref:helix-turn-helix domain-containing protein n=1 Tax=Candidatus Poriferisodalis sp. TaxID=3101277 RepID=UPI003B52D8E1
MPSTTSYRKLHDQIAARPGAAERLAALREETHSDIGLYELRRALDRSQTDLAVALGISQSAVSQLERGDDIRVSTLRSYIARLGGKLRLVAVFDDGDEQTELPIEVGAGRRAASRTHGTPQTATAQGVPDTTAG